LPTANPTWLDPGLNPGRRGRKPTTNRLSYGAALMKVRWSYRCNRPWRPLGLWDVEAPTSARQSAHRRRWCCQPHAPAARYPSPTQVYSWYSFLLEAESIPGP
jgi:hypothetical protein